MARRTAERQARIAELAGGELWKLAIAEIESLVNVGMIHPLDEPKLVSIFLECYAVGDRPTVEEIDQYLAELWPGQSDRMRRHVVSFWKRVLKNPEHRFKCLSWSWMWRHPFLILDQVAEREGLVSTRDRLVEQVHLATDAYAASLAAAPASDETDDALRRLAFAVRALTIWGVSRDAHPEGRWSGNIFRPAQDPLSEFEWRTNRGRSRRERREAEMLERYRRELDEDRVRRGLEPWGAEGPKPVR